MRCPRCQHENLPTMKFCGECGTPLERLDRTPRSYADLNAEVESLRRSLNEALEQQTATGEILRVISRSPTDVLPVFDAIVANAVQICDGRFGAVMRLQDGLLHLAAYQGFSPEALEMLRGRYPLRREDAGFTGLAAARGEVVRSDDVAHDPRTAQRDLARVAGYNAFLAVPMIREHQVVGVINVARAEPFTDQQMALIQTFADQAVIAIENVRLFKELQASNRDLTTALDKQTATGDILRVISQSQTDVQPVFDAIVDSAVRLLRGFVAAMSRLAGDKLELVAFTSTDSAGDAAVRFAFPQPLHSDWPHARVVRNRASLNVADARSDSQLPEAIRNVAVVRGYQSLVVVPLLRRDEAIGAISLTRREPGGFTDDEIALLQTFAAQAVIAIENARLLSELQARTQELTRSVSEL